MKPIEVQIDWPRMPGFYLFAEITSLGSAPDRDCPGDPGDYRIVGWGRTEDSGLCSKERTVKRLELGDEEGQASEEILGLIERSRWCGGRSLM